MWPDNTTVVTPLTDDTNIIRLDVPKPDFTFGESSTRYQVIMLPDERPGSSLASVKRALTYDPLNPEEGVTISVNNYWRDYGYIYIIDEIPKNAEATAFADKAWYTVEYGAGVIINVVEYGRRYMIEGEDEPQTAYYD